MYWRTTSGTIWRIVGPLLDLISATTTVSNPLLRPEYVGKRPVNELNTVANIETSAGWSVKSCCGVVLCGTVKSVQRKKLQVVVRDADEAVLEV